MLHFLTSIFLYSQAEFSALALSRLQIASFCFYLVFKDELGTPSSKTDTRQDVERQATGRVRACRNNEEGYVARSQWQVASYKLQVSQEKGGRGGDDSLSLSGELKSFACKVNTGRRKLVKNRNAKQASGESPRN